MKTLWYRTGMDYVAPSPDLGREADALSALAPILGGVPEETVDAAALRAWLRREVTRMLAWDRARLMAIVYRVDVRERDLTRSLAAPDPAGSLTEALIARMAEKLRYRQPVA